LKVLKSYFFEFDSKINTFQHLIRMIFKHLKSYQQRLYYLIFYLFLFLLIMNKIVRQKLKIISLQKIMP